MKTIKYFAAAAAIALTSFATLAAELISSQQADNLTATGIVSAGHATTLSSLEKKLAAKADAQGASSYRIISAGGNNMLSGTANLQIMFPVQGPHARALPLFPA